MKQQSKGSYVFGVEVEVENILKVTGTYHVMHVVILAYKAIVAGKKKLVALMSRVTIMFKVGGYNASIAQLGQEW
jgi:hypothetical protein